MVEKPADLKLRTRYLMQIISAQSEEIYQQLSDNCRSKQNRQSNQEILTLRLCLIE